MGLRSEKLPSGHVILPELHRLAENTIGYARCTEMGGEGQSIWAGADDGDIAGRLHTGPRRNINKFIEFPS
jgi:hypothetical protein